MQKPRVLIVQPIAQEGTELLINAGMEVMFAENASHETLCKYIVDCDAMLVRTAPISRELMEKGTKLRVIAKHGIGTDNIDVEFANEKGIYVCNAPNSNTNSVAEHTVGLILSLAHNINRADKAVRQGHYEARYTFIGTELKGRTLGLIGFGNIGKLVAKKCFDGFGMQIVVYDPYAKNKEDFRDVQFVDKVDELYKESDFISLHLPYLASLHHFINEESFSKMKKSAFLINCARGGLVDEKALYKALTEGEIAGAALDVFEEEPTPVKHPLWQCDQVVVTPHMAAHSKEALVNMATGAAEEIIRVLHGDKPRHCVNDPI
ncbi:hydroxyacid dehydrogenase [Brevibacillus sp. B_LB10_24]|uniref:hydroxyacid dehydrogenase n=1 Tax=Brevibacillus sp. B_LB10_24 TaxID=3380645 RepID=UPI0038BC31DA